MRVLVIVVTYNGIKWAGRCFGSIAASEVPLDAIVLDNGSTDGTPEWVRTNYPQFEVVENKANLGFGAANNIGMRLALERGYDYVYLLNQDAWLFPDTIGRLVEAASSYENHVILSPLQMNDGLQEMNSLFKNRVMGGVAPSGETLRDVPFVMAAHWLLSRKCLEKVGLFSPLFYFNGEDDNYCARVLYHGLKIGVVPGAVAVHDIGNRKQPKERRVFRSVYTYSLHRLSDPRRCPVAQLFYVIPYSLYSCAKFASFLPLKYMALALKDFRKAVRLRKESMSEGAFIR